MTCDMVMIIQKMCINVSYQWANTTQWDTEQRTTEYTKWAVYLYSMLVRDHDHWYPNLIQSQQICNQDLWQFSIFHKFYTMNASIFHSQIVNSYRFFPSPRELNNFYYLKNGKMNFLWMKLKQYVDYIFFHRKSVVSWIL